MDGTGNRKKAEVWRRRKEGLGEDGGDVGRFQEAMEVERRQVKEKARDAERLLNGLS